MNVIAEFSDYAVDGVNFFIDSLNAGFAARDIAGLSNNKIQVLQATKEHPLISLLASMLNDGSKGDVLRANIIPAVSVTPGNSTEDGVTLGHSKRSFDVDEDFITYIKKLSERSNKDVQKEGLISKQQIDVILAAYRKQNDNAILHGEQVVWSYNEEINISCWAASPDVDTLLARITDAVLADISVADEKNNVRNMKWHITRGLTNFNYGRVLFGSEFAVTFYNEYSNFKIFSEGIFDFGGLNGSFRTTGDK